MIETVSKDAEFKRVMSNFLKLFYILKNKFISNIKIDRIEQDLLSTVGPSLLHFLVIMKWRYS